jgi:hypothetical protein
VAARARAQDRVVASKFGKLFYEFSLCSIVHRFIRSTEHVLLRLCLNSSLNQIRKYYSGAGRGGAGFFNFGIF